MSDKAKISDCWKFMIPNKESTESNEARCSWC